MSLSRFAPANHPQQVKVTGGDPEKDERYTKRSLIVRLHAQWHFTVDAASAPKAPSSAIIGRFWTKADDGLRQAWDGERVWCNPPYSNIAPWVRKAWLSRAVAVLLVPANRTEQAWWQTMVEPFRDRRDGVLRTEFLERRINFGTPERPEADDWNSSPPFGCVLLIWPTADRPAQINLFGWSA
jgi:phage N-6-adenine-methyltransferase